MALSISNTLGTQTTTPSIPVKGRSIFDMLGGGNYGIGGKPLFPNAPSTAVQGPAATSTAGLLGAPKKNPVSSAQNGIAGTYQGQSIYSGKDIAAQIAAIDASMKNAGSTQSQTQTGSTPSLGIGTTKTKGLVKPTAPTYDSLITGLVSASKPSTNQTDLLKQLTQAGEQNTGIGQQAQYIAGQYAPEIARVGQLGAAAEAGYGSTGSNIVGEGNAAIASNNASERMNALAAGETAQLAGNQQQLTAQNQLQSAYGTALGGANTQQQQTITGYNAAAGFAQPSPASYGQTVFNPLTGSFSGGQGNLDPQTASTNLASAVLSGQMSYDDAVSSLGYAGGAGMQFLNNAILAQNPSANINQLRGTAAATQQNATTLGTAQTTGQAAVLQQLPAMESANTAAEGIKSKITTYLASNPQLNPSNLAVGNTLQQWIQGKQLTDPKYQTLFNYLNEYTNTLAPILGVGGDATNLKTQIAQSFINAAASGQSIATVLDNMQQLSSGKISDLRSGATGGGVVSSPITGSGTGSGGKYGF